MVVANPPKEQQCASGGHQSIILRDIMDLLKVALLVLRLNHRDQFQLQILQPIWIDRICPMEGGMREEDGSMFTRILSIQMVVDICTGIKR